MNKLSLPLFLFLILLFVYFSWTYVRTTPQYSLFNAYQAVSVRDYQAFTKYADVDQIVDTYVAQKFKNNDTEQNSDNILLQLRTTLMNALQKNLKPAAANTTKAIIRKGVESGTFFALYKPHTVFIMLITAQVIQVDDVASVEIREKDKQTITLKMRKLPDHWQVYEVTFPVK
ncbi:MAG: hypothetical protein WAV30_05035 [Microgenomates group bacterium]